MIVQCKVLCYDKKLSENFDINCELWLDFAFLLSAVIAIKPMEDGNNDNSVIYILHDNYYTVSIAYKVLVEMWIKFNVCPNCKKQIKE